MEEVGTWDLAEPDPGALIESLRAFGYTLETAVADLVDNSITAGAKTIDIRFEWGAGASRVVIRDDGKGMDASELVNAMRPGSRSPLEFRLPDDLGRFGLGLKTASFSQGRQLTVISKRAGSPLATRTWDLDTVVRTHQWRLLREPPHETLGEVNSLQGEPHGTSVVWGRLDRVVSDSDPGDDFEQRRFLERARFVAEHLQMTFHRFIGARTGRLNLRVNGRPLSVWDPFLARHAGVQALPAEVLAFGPGSVVVRPFVLPHHSHMSTDDFDTAGRTDARGWNSLQGFYVYRNRRLLVAGDWLGLGYTKEEHYKLARIQVDLANDMDDSWQIDVKKSTARPPNALRADLKRIANVTRARSVEVYRHRGKVITRNAGRAILPLWEQVLRHGRISYRLNRDHPALADCLASPTIESLKSLLRLIEESVPVALISLNSTERPQDHSAPFETAPSEIAKLAGDLVGSFVRAGSLQSEAVQRVLSMEPFHRFPELATSPELRNGSGRL